MRRPVRVGILGATGTVGQRFVKMLDHHPEFEVTALAASDRSKAQCYAEACTWRLPGEIPEYARDLVVLPLKPPLECEVVFSSLPGPFARAVEMEFARAGYPVISNSSAFRMEPDVPLLVPEVNPGHLRILQAQREKGRFGAGCLVANPNCSAVILTLALAPLHQRFGLEAVAATTIQAVSGAGYPGVASLDILDNVLPYIAGEEEKIEQETRKILGRAAGSEIELGGMKVSAQCHRANVSDGHLVAARVSFSKRARIDDVREAFESFRGVPQELRLHSAPERPIIFRDEPDRPQPRLDRDAGGGMSVTVGRLAPDTVFDYRFVALGHNTIRGAAGAALLNAELANAQGVLHARESATTKH